MPRYPVPRVQKWAAEEPSVLESPMERGLRTAAQWIGLDKPTHPAELVNPAVNIYWNNPAARALETNVFVDKAAKLGKAVHEAAQNFAKRYPRMAAHIDPRLNKALGQRHPTVEAATRSRLYRKGGKVGVDFTPLGIAKTEANPSLAKNILFHEGIHGAQQLGNKNFGELYTLAEDYIDSALPNYTKYGRYRMNPFELPAFSRGEFEQFGGDSPIWQNAIEGLKNMLRKQGRNINAPTYDKIVEILQQRGHDMTGFEKWGGGTY